MECFNNEVRNLKQLSKYNFFPKVIYFNNSDKNNLYFAQTLKGPNLKRLFFFMKKSFDPLTILNIAYDLIICLSSLHQENIVHDDLKPTNYVWDYFQNNKNIPNIILIDFSCSNYNKTKTKKYHASGNYFYSSVYQNENKVVRQKDEIESLIYTLLYFTDIKLPWIEFYQKTNKYKCKNLELKKNFQIEKYLKDELKIFKMIFNDIKMESEKNRIDYDFFNKLILQELNSLKNNNEYQYRFNWEKEIKNIIINYIKTNDASEFENRICNDLFIGFPKELVFESLKQYFEITKN